MEPSFRIDFVKDATRETAILRGNIDAQAEPQFRELMTKVSGAPLAMDFSQTGRINSMGIALLLRTIKGIKAEKQADIRIQGHSQINGMLFKMTGIFMLAPETRAPQ
jgi:anti-anti-sigma factor